MKRTHLALDANLLDEAKRVLGLKTYSATVNRALSETLRVRKNQTLSTFFFKHLWEGNLAAMREDCNRPQTRSSRSFKRRRRLHL
jgi:hypothetical protein